jgi:hypothetical protein
LNASARIAVSSSDWSATGVPLRWLFNQVGFVMRRGATALAIAVVISIVSIGLSMMFEPRVSMARVFAPGFALINGLKQLGVETTNRTAVLGTLLFWWFATWLVLIALNKKRTQDR